MKKLRGDLRISCGRRLLEMGIRARYLALPHSLKRTIIVGPINFAFGYLIFVLLWWLLSDKFSYLVISATALLIAIIEAHLMNGHFVWNKTPWTLTSLIRFSCLQLVVLLIGNLFVPKVSHSLGIHLYIVQFVFSVTFLLGILPIQKRWVFRVQEQFNKL